ncbi:MAG: DUF1287 domain-containing protein [Clostridia bacterium]|nr:DUF1287 domain-containing protein [Clostridia bacterium]
METERRTKPRRRRGRFLLLALVVALAAGIRLTWPRSGLWGMALFTQLRYGIETARSPVDYDGDGLDDYADFMLAARAYVRSNPVYDSEYYADGYPPAGRGVCTDVIWRALAAAGYDLKALLDRDIAAHPSLYPLPNGEPDPNIDFRRVVNLDVFFGRFCQRLTVDTARTDQWQPGDIVVYEGHVAVVSDRRNAQGRPWVIHHTGHGAFEEDALDYKRIIGHYRWLLT